ncbi:unnamed protein product [Closterium sp. NIES-54]
MEHITMQLDLTPSVWEEGEEAAAKGGAGEKVQEAPAGGGDDKETSGSTKEAAGSEGGEEQQGSCATIKEEAEGCHYEGMGDTRLQARTYPYGHYEADCRS